MTLEEFKKEHMYGTTIDCEQTDFDILVESAIRHGYAIAVSDENKSRIARDWEPQKVRAVLAFFKP